MTATRTFDILVECIVRIHIFVLAAFYAIKELYFEFKSQKIATRLNNEINASPIVRQVRKAALITGADGTIGLEITRRLLKLGFEVKALVKTHKGSPLESLENDYSTDKRIVLYEVDLEKPRQVSHFLDNSGTFGTVNLVVLCAGVMFAAEKYHEDIESHMCVNLVSQAMLVDGLQDHFNSETRIIALSSSCLRAAHNFSINEETFRQYLGPYHAYASSKLLLSLYISQLAKKRDLLAVSVHPGVVPGRLYRHVNIFLKIITYFFLPFIMRTPVFSAQLVLHTALRKDLISGGYYEDENVQEIFGSYTEEEKNAIYNAVSNKIKSLRA